MNKKLIIAIKDIIIKAGELSLVLREKGLTIKRKNDNSIVTNGDKAVSNYIYEQLKILDNSIPIICEEQLIQDVSNNSFFWIIDPIDSTYSYINNKSSYTINIALIHNNIPIIGFIYQPVEKKLYFTNKNGKNCLEINGEESNINNRHKGLIAVVGSKHIDKKTSNFLKKYKFIKVIAIASSIKLSMIAEGNSDVYPKFSKTMEWDIAAGHALINAAGGKLVDIKGIDMKYGKKEFINPNFFAYSKKWVESKL